MARSAQYIDENGFLLIKGCPVSSPGIFDYSAAQVGETEHENHGALDRIVRVFRPAAAVYDPLFIESLKNVPLIDDHEYMIGDETVLDASEQGQLTAPEEKGVEGVMTDNVYWADPWLRADLKVFSRRLQAAIKAGKRDLSLGYISHFEYNPGTHDGMPYEYIQTHMRGNHIALVDEGRVPGARVLDGLVFDSMSFAVPSSPNPNPKESAMDENMLARLNALLPVLEKMCGAEGGAAAPAAATAEGAAEGAEAAAAIDPAAGAAGVEEGAAEGATVAAAEDEDPHAALDRIEALLKKLAGVGTEATEAKHDLEGGDEAGEEGEEAVGDNSDTDGELTADSEHEIVSDNDGEEVAAADAVSGLEDENGGNEITVDSAPEGAVKASPGPKQGLNTDKITGDAAFRKLVAQIDDRNKLAQRISKHVGTFDHARMTLTEVSDYGCAKLGIKARGAQGRLVLDGMLMGLAKAAPKQAATRTADSAVSGLSPEMRAHLGL